MINLTLLVEENFSTGLGTLGLFPVMFIIGPGGLFMTMFCGGGLTVVTVLIDGAARTVVLAANFLVAFLSR